MAGKPTHRRARANALDHGLKAMFRALEQRPIPDGVRSVVEQLDTDGEAASRPSKKAG